MRRLLFLLLLLFIASPFVSEAQKKYKQGTILFQDGSTKEGLIKPPNDPNEKAVEYKTDEDAKKEKIPSDNIKEVIIPIDGYENRFVRGEVRRPKVKEPKTDADYKVMGPIWMVEMVKGPATLYAAGPMMKIQKDGYVRVTLNWDGKGVPPDIFFYGQRDGEPLPSWVAFYSEATFGQMKTFKYWTSRYFADYPELVTRIEAEEFKVIEIADVFEAYNSWKGE